MNSEFEWVTARANCSASQVYGDLADQIKHDVELRNGSLSGKERRFEVNFTYKGGYRPTSLIIAALKGGQLLQEVRLADVTFTKVPDGIAVEYSDGKKLVGILTLSEDGDCRLKVDDTEYSFWQFRRLTLEPVLFDAVKEYRE